MSDINNLSKKLHKFTDVLTLDGSFPVTIQTEWDGPDYFELARTAILKNKALEAQKLEAQKQEGGDGGGNEGGPPPLPDFDPTDDNLKSYGGKILNHAIKFAVNSSKKQDDKKKHATQGRKILPADAGFVISLLEQAKYSTRACLMAYNIYLKVGDDLLAGNDQDRETAKYLANQVRRGAAFITRILLFLHYCEHFCEHFCDRSLI